MFCFIAIFPKPMETEDCVRQYDWQIASIPSCTLIHEVEQSRSRLVGSGYWRDVWRVKDSTGSAVVLKTLRYKHEWEERNYDRHRRDAVAMERLKRSPYVIDVYGFCGNSVLTELGRENLNAFIRRKEDPLTMLQVAYQIAHGIADLHNSDVEGVPSIAHADIAPQQFVLVDGIYKLVGVTLVHAT